MNTLPLPLTSSAIQPQKKGAPGTALRPADISTIAELAESEVPRADDKCQHIADQAEIEEIEHVAQNRTATMIFHWMSRQPRLPLDHGFNMRFLSAPLPALRADFVIDVRPALLAIVDLLIRP